MALINGSQIIVVFVLVATAVVIFLMFRPRLSSGSAPNGRQTEKHVQIVVLGDIGRSPRMQYHALSILKHGGTVDFVGYRDSALHPELENNPRIQVIPLEQMPGFFNKLPFMILGPLKVLHQVMTLGVAMMVATCPARWVIIQNPPSIPTMQLAWVVALLRGSHVMIDWHNFGWSILATSRGSGHVFVHAYRFMEAFFGRQAPTCNLAVTEAMARQLQKPPYSLGTPVLTLHDRPAAIFQPTTSESQRKAVLSRIDELQGLVNDIVQGHMRLIVSSTSWTPDEDFGLLLDALVTYASGSASENRKPIVAVITGKGPQKAKYLDEIARLTKDGQLPNVRIFTAWLSTEDYAGLLASADLGVCLHMSSSGVDLPMKVVDMFGSGLPVAAYSGYESFGELVREGENGCGFTTAHELADVLARLLNESGVDELAMLKKGAIREGSLRWDEEWDRVVGRIVGMIDP